MNKCILLAPVLLLIPLSGAMAQAGGSYRGSCSNINQDGSMLTAECRGPGGQRFTTSIDTARCRGGIANTNGRLTCGGVQGSAMPSRGGGGQDYGQSDDGYQGRPRPRGPRYAPPPQDFGYDAPRPRPPRPYYGDDQGPPPPPPPPRYDDDDD